MNNNNNNNNSNKKKKRKFDNFFVLLRFYFSRFSDTFYNNQFLSEESFAEELQTKKLLIFIQNWNHGLEEQRIFIGKSIKWIKRM